MNTNIEFYNLSADVINAMEADKNAAAAEFWAYPGQEWQLGFELDWLHQNGYEVAALKAAASLALATGDAQ